MKKYICHFYSPHILSQDFVAQAESDGGISDFKDGFWLNPYNKFTKGSDAKYWVPPSRILCIEKV